MPKLLGEDRNEGSEGSPLFKICSEKHPFLLTVEVEIGEMRNEVVTSSYQSFI